MAQAPKVEARDGDVLCDPLACNGCPNCRAPGLRNKETPPSQETPLPNPFAALLEPPATSEGSQGSITQLGMSIAPPDAVKAEKLREALAHAKKLIAALRLRIVYAESVAYIWSTVPNPSERGEARKECGEIIRRICSVDGDLSLRTALEELDREVEAYFARRRVSDG